MLYWKTLLAAADEQYIDRDKHAATQWADIHLNAPVPFDRDEWIRWKQAFVVLRWMDEPTDTAPPSIRNTIDKCLSGVRFGLKSNWLDDGACYRLPRADGSLADRNTFERGFPDDQRTVMAAAFLSFFGAIDPPNSCHMCGYSVGYTPKTGKPSRSRFCSSSCCVRHHRSKALGKR